MLNTNSNIFHEIVTEIAVRRNDIDMHNLEYVRHGNNRPQNFQDAFKRTMFGQKCKYKRIGK